jgi:hypothetical protein
MEEDTRSTVAPVCMPFLPVHVLNYQPRSNDYPSEIEFFTNLKRLCVELGSEILFILSGPIRPLYPLPGAQGVVE